MIQMKPFSKFDWMGFAGATSFPGGAEPLSGELKLIVEGIERDAIAVLDAEMLSVMYYVPSNDGDDTEDKCVHFVHPFAGRALAMLQDRMDLVELAAMSGAEASE